MTDAGFFRGTSADQDNRFADKQKKLLKELNFSPILNTKLNMSKIELDGLKPWIEQKIKDILEMDDDILSDSIFEFLKDKEPDGKGLLVLITGFVDESKSAKFVEELWTKLIEVQDNSNGVSPKLASPPDNGVPSDRTTTPADDSQRDADRQVGSLTEVGDVSSDRERNSRSRTRTPPSQTNSQQRSDSQRGSPNSKKTDPKSGSKSPSKSGSKSPTGSRSVSRSRSGSHSRSRSKSSSRSPRRSRSRSRSLVHRPSRTRRSRSRSGSYRRRSRSPRARRGYGRFAYRGFSYDRRRGPVGPPRRRPSPPWVRRRFSPGSPQIRRRRTPSPMSPRRRSRSPYYRRRSRSRSPPPPPYGHMMGHRSPRPPIYGGRPDLGPRPMPPHREMHRPLLTGRSPHLGPLEHRGYSDAPILPRHSPGNMMMSRQHDLPPISHNLPGPSVPHRSPSPSSGRKKHKKDKKHRKHKKSRRHRSSTPEKKKKHKKHKKTKKHKS